jgi:hypothetical protein
VENAEQGLDTRFRGQVGLPSTWQTELTFIQKKRELSMVVLSPASPRSHLASGVKGGAAQQHHVSHRLRHQT